MGAAHCPPPIISPSRGPVVAKDELLQTQSSGLLAWVRDSETLMALGTQRSLKQVCSMGPPFSWAAHSLHDLGHGEAPSISHSPSECSKGHSWSFPLRSKIPSRLQDSQRLTQRVSMGIKEARIWAESPFKQPPAPWPQPPICFQLSVHFPSSLTVWSWESQGDKTGSSLKKGEGKSPRCLAKLFSRVTDPSTKASVTLCLPLAPDSRPPQEQPTGAGEKMLT